MYASVFEWLGFGLVTSWTFGREYSDLTLKDMLVLPVLRGKIAIAKYVAIIFWCFIMMLISFAYALTLGFSIGLPGFSFAIVQHYLFLILYNWYSPRIIKCTSCPVCLYIAWLFGADQLCIYNFNVGIGVRPYCHRSLSVLACTCFTFAGKRNILYFPCWVLVIY
ncbi:hypothetical protein J2T19_002986 [Paenibacillus tundrae]|uniref:Uncharacterized protein n=1 Tax=Paenibacillus tundrae TaxID=528187 RepID=A0ABT9WE70_9BACL|nr:hypothetical protein [Paenibacillus tundrae]